MACWAVNPLVRFYWRGWAFESVVFEAVSGQIAAIDALEAAVLGCFEAGPRDLESVTVELASDLSLVGNDDLKARLFAIIEGLVVRGWLQPADAV